MTATLANNVDLAFLEEGGESARLILAADWSVSPLGMPQNWPVALKQALAMLLLNPVPAFICWGEKHLLLYNDAFKRSYQPKEIGQPFKDSFVADWAVKLADLSAADFFDDLQITISPLKDHLGNSCGFWGIGQQNQLKSIEVLVDELQTVAFDAGEIAEKQARLAAIVNSSDDIIISKQLDGTITSWNAAAEKKFGYGAKEAIGKHISLVIPPDRLDEEDYIISQISQGHKVNHFDTVRLAKDGAALQLSITVSPIVDVNGKVIGASKIARDISAQVEARAATLRYTERLEIMNMVSNAISEELDLNSILQKVTDASTELTGAKFGAFFYNRTDENGDSYLLYTLSGEDRASFEKLGMPRNTAVFHPTFAGEGVLRVDDVTKDPRYGQNHPHKGMPKGHFPVVSYLAVPVISRSGKVIGGLFFGHPEPARFTAEHESLVVAIAAQAAMGIDNAMLYEKVLELNDKKDEFIGLASHELKTPLASINGYLQILNRLVKDLSAQKFLGKASLQVRKLTALVNDLLDVSKIEAGKLKLTIANFDLKTVVEDAVELIKNTAGDYEIVLLDAPDLCLVDGDSQRIEQVIINLLSNAIKYAPGTNKIEIRLAQVKDEVLVGITDFGLGIAADKIKHLFLRFYRIDEATPNISGLGIGLYLSHEIISRHHGKIWVDSELGKGSTFWFSLPCVAAK